MRFSACGIMNTCEYIHHEYITNIYSIKSLPLFTQQAYHNMINPEGCLDMYNQHTFTNNHESTYKGITSGKEI